MNYKGPFQPPYIIVFNLFGKPVYGAAAQQVILRSEKRNLQPTKGFPPHKPFMPILRPSNIKP